MVYSVANTEGRRWQTQKVEGGKYKGYKMANTEGRRWQIQRVESGKYGW